MSSRSATVGSVAIWNSSLLAVSALLITLWLYIVVVALWLSLMILVALWLYIVIVVALWFSLMILVTLWLYIIIIIIALWACIVVIMTIVMVVVIDNRVIVDDNSVTSATVSFSTSHAMGWANETACVWLVTIVECMDVDLSASAVEVQIVRMTTSVVAVSVRSIVVEMILAVVSIDWEYP